MEIKLAGSIQRKTVLSCAVWPKFLIEFKGSQPDLRIQEFRDSFTFVLKMHKHEFTSEVIERYDGMTTSIPDNTFPGVPLCTYVNLPDSKIGHEIASRCSLIRTIVDVWGDAHDPHSVLVQALETFSPIMASSNHSIDSISSWRVLFRRCGRSGKSGLDAVGKKDLLDVYKPLLCQLSGEVDLKNATQDIIHLEDWHTFKHSDNTSVASPGKTGHCILGRVVGNGTMIQTTFDLKDRPFVGTTSMKAIPAHVTAVAALIGPGQLVLDPFCGTGSLLIAAANLGANVVGSDVDGMGLGLELSGSDKALYLRGDDKHCDEVEWKNRRKAWKQLHESKNANFQRKDGTDQAGLCTVDNFHHYNLHDRLTELIKCDVALWLPNADVTVNSSISKYDKFDAIVTDPPYGKREHARKTSPSSNTESGIYGIDGVLPTLLQVAIHRLKPTGRLVFWYPSESGEPREAILTRLEELLGAVEHTMRVADGDERPLKVLSVARETLSSMWRWMCVIERR